MTISSSLYAGVAGLNANATRLATISDNIANSSTYGYKRAEAEFQSLVLSGNGGAYSAGGVTANTSRAIDERGPLITTNSPTDLAVAGGGMLPVTGEATLATNSGNYPLSLVTTGSFEPNADGVLSTNSGLVLMGWPANPDGTVPSYPRDSVQGLAPVTVNYNEFFADPTTGIDLAVNLPATETTSGASGDPIEMSVEYFGNLGTSETLAITYTPTVPASGQSNTWAMTVRDSASGGAVIGQYTLAFDPTRGGGGTLDTVTTLSGGVYDAATGVIDLTVGGGPLDLRIGMVGDQNGFTQLSDTFAPVTISKNGSQVGTLTAVEVDPNGYVYALYDSGVARVIYQVPLVDVPNTNGLISQDNQSYQISQESGSFFLWDASSGPVGEVVSFALEESATDTAAELTNLIVTQRAYSSNAKVIQTVDEMLQETTNIKR
ncbi:MAG: flagellar hook-basal body complex protein [Dinoroseobacter sp.]|nr:flagellar hook-basal body complex protein [Dinoroseobacter sp.]MDJ0993276.1 flagellar hook-basal body complex protein [Dinoroseobacter sp.]